MKIFFWVLGGAVAIGFSLFVAYIIAMSRIH